MEYVEEISRMEGGGLENIRYLKMRAIESGKLVETQKETLSRLLWGC